MLTALCMRRACPRQIALLSHDLKAMMRAGRASGAVDRQSGIKMVEMKALSADLGRIVSGGERLDGRGQGWEVVTSCVASRRCRPKR